MSNGVKVHATVKIEVEVSQGTWGGDCGLAQVYRQAKEGAVAELARVLGTTSIRIVGNPKVTAVLVPEVNES